MTRRNPHGLDRRAQRVAPSGLRPRGRPAIDQIVRVKLAHIDTTPHYQIRLGGHDLRNLVALREQGQRDPVHLQRKPDRMRILDGHDRVACAAALGWSDIGALVHEVDDLEARRLSWELNAARVEFSPLERLNAIEIFTEAGLQNQEIAQLLGLKHVNSVTRLRASLPLSRRYWPCCARVACCPSTSGR